ncbi:Endoribonuclease L-PSP [Mycena indigotica]|uniref:Endoribonuclease L-PSP n=1 Tax=Mycena indigotica TaxID=2126181 RepID=A0A8H6SXF8_9AGAR|nr:Endoribonuclease L-PSP [Mycena indigotica]KAF7306900.1 Endoribonuclease L-PSP [Mycena indigotica]
MEKLDSPALKSFGHILSHAVKGKFSIQRPRKIVLIVNPLVPGLIFLSGQTPTDETGTVVAGGIQEHTAQCIHNLGKVLEAAGSSWEKVVKVNVYLDDMNNFKAMNEVYEKLLPNPKPARTCIQAGHLPNSVDVEIEAIATY